jgi:MSHA biogenesis protein MshI
MKTARTKKEASAAGWTAVDFGAREVLGATVRSGPKPQVVKCGVAPEAELNGALASLAKKLSTPGHLWTTPLKRGDYKLVVVPRPAVQQSEMAESVRWSLGSILDFPLEDAAVDWMTIPTVEHMPDKPQQLYAITTRKAVVNERVAPFARAKVPVHAVDIRETAQRNIAALVERPGEGLGMLSMDAEGVQITFTFNGELYLDRFISEPFDVMLAADEESRARIFDRITLQVQRSIDFMQRTMPFIPLGRIVVAPLPAPLSIVQHLQGQIAEPTESLDLATVFDFSQTPELADEEQQSRYFIALGAALRGMAGRT